MKWKKWLENWNMTSLKMKPSFLEMEYLPKEADKDAAWELYIELLTRITTQDYDDIHGEEKTALTSVYKIFELTREIIKKYKRDCIEFSKIAIVILNQKIRPFTAKWHYIEITDGFDNTNSKEFRSELKYLQAVLLTYTQMLGDMAGIEEKDALTELEEV